MMPGSSRLSADDGPPSGLQPHMRRDQIDKQRKSFLSNRDEFIADMLQVDSEPGPHERNSVPRAG